MNALVAYGSDDSESEHENEEQPKSSQIHAEGRVMATEENIMIQSGVPVQQEQIHLVEPHPPRRQSDLYEDDDSGEHYSRDRGDEKDSDVEEGEETEEELLRSGQSLTSFLMADHQTTGASTPGGAGYTPRGANGLEDGELMREEEQQMEMEREEGEGMPSEVPPSPPGQCSPTLQRKFENFFERKSSGWDPNSMIKRRRDFKNPSCYETLVNLFGIDEKGTNFPAEVFDPNAFEPDDFYDALGDHQAAMEAKRKRHQQNSLEPSSKRPAVSLPTSKSESDQKQAAVGRKSRFEGK